MITLFRQPFLMFVEQAKVCVGQLELQLIQDGIRDSDLDGCRSRYTLTTALVATIVRTCC